MPLSADKVTVHVTLLGGGFGRKSKCDFALEAALLSKELGAPVKVQWTREDDIHHGFLHTVSVERLPLNLLDALRELEKSEVLGEALGALVPAYLKLKHQEWNEFSRHLTDWEREMTLDC